MKPTALSVDPAGHVGVTQTVRVTFFVTRIDADYASLPTCFRWLRPLLELAARLLLNGRLKIDVHSVVHINGEQQSSGYTASGVAIERPLSHDVTTRIPIPQCCGAAWARGRSDFRDSLSALWLVRRN